MVFINKELKCVFIHNPKCGGSYISNILMNCYHFNEITSIHSKYDMFFDDPKQIKMDENTDKHTIRKFGKYRYFLSHQDMEQCILKNYFKFTFVRNPYTKIYSAYQYLKRRLNESTMRNKIRNSYENYDYFKDFNTFVKNYKNINNISYFHAFIPQYEQLIDFSGNINIQYIGKTETLDRDFVEILTIIGITQMSEHANFMYYGNKINESLNSEENIITSYTEETFQFVNSFFSKDFDVFGYTKFNSLDDFKSNCWLNKEIPKNEPPCFTNIYNNLLLSKVNNGLVYSLLIKQDLLIDSLLEALTNYSNSNIVRNELNNIKTTVLNLRGEKNMLAYNPITNVLDEIFEINKSNLYLKKHKCPKCSLETYNAIANNAHIIFCN